MTDTDTDIVDQINEQMKFSHDYDLPFLNAVKAEIERLTAENKNWQKCLAKGYLDGAEEERERNCAAICEGCRLDAPLYDRGGQLTHREPWPLSCRAAAIRGEKA